MFNRQSRLGLMAAACAAFAASVGLFAATGPGADPEFPVLRESGSRLQRNPATSGTNDCASCHEFHPLFSHPTDVVPSMAVPAMLPLDNGMLTCTTCHEVTPEHPTGPPTSPRAGLIGPSLCNSCHSPSGAARPAAHATGMAWAHLPLGSQSHGKLEIDPETGTCMGCHDGMVASDVGSHASPLFMKMGNAEHPVGVAYQSRPPSRNSEAIQLVDRARLDPRVRLFGGAIGCGSCHSIYSDEDHLLVVSNLRSQLCLSCHDQ
jgi:predicted CXXCH cytochrome family protein